MPLRLHANDRFLDVDKRFLMAARASYLKLKNFYAGQEYDVGIHDEGENSQRRLASFLEHEDKTRRRRSVLLLAVMWGIALFSWGLDDTLSLYRSGIAKHAVPAATLLLQKERPAANLMTVSVWDIGQPWPRDRHLRALDTKAEGAPPEVEGGSQESPRSGAFRLQKARRVNRGNPRAPPAVFESTLPAHER